MVSRQFTRVCIVHVFVVLSVIHNALKLPCPVPIDLHFVDAYLGTEVEPTGIAGQEDDGLTQTPWAWIVERRRPMSVIKWSGTLVHTNHRNDLIGATVCAFAHFAYTFSKCSVVFADIQGVFNHYAGDRLLMLSYLGTHSQISPGVEGIILFDVMTHTTTG